MTEGQYNRITGRKTYKTITVRTFTKHGVEFARVAAVNPKGILTIEFWSRKVSELSDKAFKRQTVVTA